MLNSKEQSKVSRVQEKISAILEDIEKDLQSSLATREAFGIKQSSLNVEKYQMIQDCLNASLHDLAGLNYHPMITRNPTKEAIYAHIRAELLVQPKLSTNQIIARITHFINWQKPVLEITLSEYIEILVLLENEFVNKEDNNEIH